MDQSSFWTVDAAGGVGKTAQPLIASPEPGRMLAFAPFLGFIWRMSVWASRVSRTRTAPLHDQKETP